MTLVREITETQVARRLASARIVASAAFDAPEQAGSAAAALMRGGVRCLEVVVGRPGTAGASAIRAARRVEGLLVGAGNVVDPEQAERALRAGAQFATAPGTNITVVHACRELELPFFPGVATPSEIERLQSLGVRAMSVFPVAALGGTSFLEAVATAYPSAGFLPGGGIRPEALRGYAALPSVLAVVCTWIVRSEHLRTHNYDRVERLAREARATVARH